MHTVTYLYTKTMQNFVILVTFVEFLQIHIDLKLDCTGSLPHWHASRNSKTIDYTRVGLQNKYCFLDDSIIVSAGSECDHVIHVSKCQKKLNESLLCINLQKGHLDKTEIQLRGYTFTHKGYLAPESKTATIFCPPYIFMALF